MPLQITLDDNELKVLVDYHTARLAEAGLPTTPEAAKELGKAIAKRDKLAAGIGKVKAQRAPKETTPPAVSAGAAGPPAV